MDRIPGLYIASSDGKGRGVFTSTDIPKDSLIEVCQLIIIPKAELPVIHRTVLHDYYFLWKEPVELCALALGNGSIYNHSVHSNANFILDPETKTMDIVSIKDIRAGDEIFINYNGEPGNANAVWWEE